MEDTESAVIVVVPEAEPIVGRHRQRYDTAAGWGVPAHVTVLYPFVAPADLDHDVLVSLDAVVQAVPRFRAEFARTRWFGDEVLWLAPEPDVPFRTLTEAVWSAFPDYPPYEGAHEDVTPHLTVGDREPVRGELAAIEREISPQLPIAAEVSAVHVLCGSPSPDSWHVIAELPLPDPLPWY